LRESAISLPPVAAFWFSSQYTVYNSGIASGTNYRVLILFVFVRLPMFSFLSPLSLSGVSVMDNNGKESAIDELRSEFHKQWDNGSIDFAPLSDQFFRIDLMLTKAYEMGKRVAGNKIKIDAWQPIETAPKTGREFLTRNGNQGGVKRLISFDCVHGYWQSKGEPVLFLQDTHWLDIPRFKGEI